jgi:hypothetical protein
MALAKGSLWKTPCLDSRAPEVAAFQHSQHGKPGKINQIYYLL